ncbi:MAG: phosphoadenylyl-sulfate reductase [Bacteroidia bacterium]|nr:phosphoadenylyl-sulfate reductase [Bacteroidia bacterium]
MNIKSLCDKYAPLSQRERMEAVFQDFDRVLITTSFGTTSTVLLQVLHQVKPDHPVYFVDTGYHFKETHQYAAAIQEKWKLNIVRIGPKPNEHNFTRMDYTWLHDPDTCCFINKVMPLEKLKETHEVWISGMLGGTTAYRDPGTVFKMGKDILRFYPFIDMTPEEARWHRLVQELPEHPLEAKGYDSIGCTHCTRRGEGRSGRWVGFNKTECGLHTFNA